MILRLVIFILRRLLGLLLVVIIGGLFGPFRAGRRILRGFGLIRRLMQL